MKRFFRYITMVLLLGLIPALSSGADSIDYEAYDAAEALYDLGLFSGTGTKEDGSPIFSLESRPTRAQAIVMLVKLLGKDAEANACMLETPFTDLNEWSKPYVGYAYAHGYTSGTGATVFGTDDYVTAPMYLTFVLKALGYEAGVDFQWNEAYLLSDELGITDGQYDASSAFTRGDIAKISVKALSVSPKEKNAALLDILKEQKIITAQQVVDFVYIQNLTHLSPIPQYRKDGTFYYSGSGPCTIRHLNMPAGHYYCVCDFDGISNFRTDLYYGKKANEYWMIGSLLKSGTCYSPLYDKYYNFDMKGKELSDTHMEINADGDWTVSFVPFTEIDFSSGKISGKGNFVSGLFTAEKDNYVIHATHTGKTLFNVHVVKYDPRGQQDFYRNAIEDYGSKEYKALLNLEKGCQYYFSVVGDGNWTIELTNVSVPAKTTSIDTVNHIYEGEGNELITGISLPEGQWYAECTYQKTKNSWGKGFSGKLFFDIPGKKYWSLGDGASAFYNKCAFFDLKGKPLENGALQINCDGKWKVVLKKIDFTSDTSFSGSGPTVTKAFPSPGDNVTITVTHNGKGSCRVRLIEYETSSRNSRAKTVCEGEGSFSQAQTFTLKATERYYFSVETEGSWTIKVSR